MTTSLCWMPRPSLWPIGGEHPGEHPLQLLVAYRGDEEPEDVQIKRALLNKSRMVELMERKSNSNVLGFLPDHYKSLFFGLLGPSPKFPRRDDLIVMALQADASGMLMGNAVMLPPPHSVLAKVLTTFLADLVRVRNYSSNMLATETAASKAQRSEPITEEDMRKPWTNEDLRSLGEYASCPKCDGGFTRWHRKAATEAEYRQLKKQYNKDMKDYERRIEKGKKVMTPMTKQVSLMVACCSYQVG